MTDASDHTAEDEAPLSPGGRTLAVVLGLYLVAIVLATLPVARKMATDLPSPPLDPLTHLWTMRWYKACLLEGKLPFRSPDIQYPVGAPLGFFPPMQLQTLFYVPLSFVVENDVLIYNLIWYFAFLYTGMATFLLAWHVLRDRASAAFAGLLAMLSTPMMLHASGHLELIHVGCFPLFLLFWLRFVDRPARGRLLAAVGAYLLVAMSAHYFVVLTIFPAALYVVGKALRAGRRGDFAWLWARAGWLAAFVAIALPGLSLLFVNQLWAIGHGELMTRPRWEFDRYGAPLWGYVLPTMAHRLGRLLLAFNPYEAAGIAATTGERASYLGVVTLGLMYYAMVRKVRFPRAAYWWSAMVLLVVLSLGSHVGVGTHRVEMPASWLWKTFFPFRLLRVPARFNMFAAVVGALVAAAGLRHLLASLPTRGARAALFGALTVAAFLDLAAATVGPSAVPTMPACYTLLKRNDPRATFLEVPLTGSGGSHLTAATGYWQALHGGKTTGGYGAHMNTSFDNLMSYNSPFAAWQLAKPDFLADPELLSIDLVSRVSFHDYAWLYLTANRLRYVVLHEWPGSLPELPVKLDRLKAQLRPAKILEDGATTVYDRELLGPPAHATLVCTEGWRRRLSWSNRYVCVVGKAGRVAVYNPDPSQDLTLELEAASFARARVVRVVAGDREVARWEVGPESLRKYTSPAFRLPEGLHELAIVSEGEDRPRRRQDQPAADDTRPFSLRVAGVNLRAATGPAPAPAIAASPRTRD
jgi:hypothetical protein